MNVRSLALALLVGLATGGLARAQIVIINDDSGEVVDMASLMNAAQAPQAPSATSEPAKPEKPSARLAKLKKLEYDRRPSAILAAWSTPLKTKEEEKKADEKTAEVAPPDALVEVKPEPVADAKPDPEAEKKKAEAEAAKKKKDEEAALKAAEAKAIEAEMPALQRNVTLGDWAAVKTYFAGLTEEERKGAFDRLLESLQKGPSQQPQVPPQGQQYLEKNRFALEDVVGLVATGPAQLTKENFEHLGKILRQALDQGHQLEGFLARLRPRFEDAAFVPTKRQLAQILVGAKEPLAIGDLLPTPEDAEKENDRDGLNLISRHSLAKFEKEKKVAWLGKAWTVTQAALAAGELSDEAKKEAIERAVEIAPRIQKELGQAWLDESFTKRPERGMEILAAIGSSASTALQSTPTDADKRTKLLELQTTAAKALLAAAPELADSWKDPLALLAGNWLREAQVTYQLDDSTSLGPRMERDPYGNFYYWNSGQMRQGGVTPIRTDKVLDFRPSDGWLLRIDATLQPRFRMIFAQLLLKVAEEAEAFPYIEQLAATDPRPAKDLVDEFLRVWTKNHDPNEQRTRSNPYVFFYGFEERANGIPLTRSKQERNLRELGEWVARLRQLPVELDVELLAGAFTRAHSTAEVYRLETIEQVFGPMAGLEPATLAELVQKMRANLATLWRDAAVQKDKRTNRAPQDIQAEVLRGYELAHSTIARALGDHPQSWELWLAEAGVEHDENDYRHEFRKDPDFSSRREAAFETFGKAARLYAEKVESLEKEKETVKVFETWFYAALGACDLKAITHERQLAARQIPLIRDAIGGLPGERAQRHMDMFASTLFTRMSNAAPGVKFRYAREGLAIVGDNKLAREARQVYAYYGDLVTEIQLRASIDGSDRVGHTGPFGLRVDLRHTREIERESGGFGKYLQNQNNASFSWNYGRPTEDYRDKFEETAREALKEHFDVVSVTFNEPEVKSKADAEYGWRLTPYAYLLLKARGPQVDRVPPLRLDLDFLDTTGYAVIPVETAALPIDASAPQGEAPPYEKLKLVQTLDERQAKDGKLILEIKASATGLVPPIEAILDVSPESFDVVRSEDPGVAVTKFDEESGGAGVLSERIWTISMRAKDGLAELPETFTFPRPKVEVASEERFRYVDADLASAEPTVSLERAYGKASRAWMWWIPAVLALAAGTAFGWRRLRRTEVAAEARFRVPEPLTPFTVLGLLRDIQRNDGLAPEQHRQLGGEIERIERHFFVAEESDAPDLRRIAETWVGRSS